MQQGHKKIWIFKLFMIKILWAYIKQKFALESSGYIHLWCPHTTFNVKVKLLRWLASSPNTNANNAKLQMPRQKGGEKR